MKKIVLSKPGGHQRLVLTDCEDLPSPSNTNIKVQIKAFGINFADIIIRLGLYKSANKFVGWPITPGFEFSGVITETGANVSHFKPGDKVFGVSLFGAYANQIIVDQDHLYRMPSQFNFATASGIPAIFLTAYYGLFQNVVVRKGMTNLS